METKSKHELRPVNAPMISSARASAAAAAPPPAMARKLETGSFARRRVGFPFLFINFDGCDLIAWICARVFLHVLQRLRV
ncbi:hypothetical protein ANCCAN_18587 [Ancylostoma caninum]|uniref:Uncharacterized protein n=1 Tax=Ancylostoma caninum TaxID=29170 RepID=A0A368FVP7_ANCCA|nr:hypothetical protein ANCCAN_18587 [Ancylostoma caninum]